MRTFKDWILLYLKGLGMGGADVVPGVSGGTIAFISGIYEELIHSINQINLSAISLLLKCRFKEFWSAINGSFLLVLVLGIGTSIISIAKLITYLLQEFPIQLWSFFFGLIVISALSVGTQIRKKNWGSVFSGLTGIAIAYAITSAIPAVTPEESWFIFICGMIAICAMILPGISGSFILLIFGKYEFILNALKDFDIGIILTFIFGCLVGILSFARLISWLLFKWHDLTIAMLAGFMIGSLYKIWPWKLTLQYRVNRAGDQVPFLEENILPTEYMELTGSQPLILYSVFFMAFGFFTIVIIEKIALAVRNRADG